MANYGITVKGLDSAGGTQKAGGQSFFEVSGQPVVVFGDPVTGHGSGSHASPYMSVDKSSWMDLNGIEVIRAGHRASCGDVTSGRDWFTIPD